MTAATTRTAPPDNDVLWARALHYAHGSTPAVSDVSLGVGQGEILAITGPRGSGKTTLLKCLSGQLLPQQGEVWFDSDPVHTLSAAARERLRRERFGWIGTRPELVPELTAWENAALPLLLAGESYRSAKRSATEWLERVDAGDIARCRPQALPQAQRQRIAIARALVTEPDVVFADEPTAPLHQLEGVQALRTLIAAARSHGITVVLTGPDGDAAAVQPADRTLTLIDGRHTSHAADAQHAGAGSVADAVAAPPGAAGAVATRAGGTHGEARASTAEMAAPATNLTAGNDTGPDAANTDLAQPPAAGANTGQTESAGAAAAHPGAARAIAARAAATQYSTAHANTPEADTTGTSAAEAAAPATDPTADSGTESDAAITDPAQPPAAGADVAQTDPAGPAGPAAGDSASEASCSLSA